MSCNFGKTEYYRCFLSEAGGDVDFATLVDTDDINTGTSEPLADFTEYTGLEADPSILAAAGTDVSNLNEKSALVTAKFVYRGGEAAVRDELIARHGTIVTMLLVNTITGVCQKAVNITIDCFPDGTGSAKYKVPVVGTVDTCLSDAYEVKTLTVV